MLMFTVQPTNHNEGSRVAFFGWCDGFSLTPFLAPKVILTNIKGLSQVRASHIYPLPLGNHVAVFAVFRPIVGEKYRLVFRDSEHGEEFFLEFSMGAAEKVESDGSVVQLEPGTTIPGWYLQAASMDVQPLLKQPGTYEVFHRTADTEIHIGTASFVHVPVTEFSNEEIAAILSDPFALKVVRVRYGCSSCGKQLMAYSALEQNEKLEAEGWVRDTILPDHFRCDCGAADFKLVYLKTGLRGLLPKFSVC